MVIKKIRKLSIVRKVAKPVVIRVKRKDGSVALIRGFKIVRKPKRIVFRKIKKEYVKNE